jgi:hypothetical protein
MKIPIPQVALACLILVVAGALLVGGATSTAAFGSFNPNWEGTSDLRSATETAGTDPVIVSNTTEYDEYGANDTTFVLAPKQSYDEHELDPVRRFLDRGGTLVIATRGGPAASQLLENTTTEARPVGPILRDERNYYRSPALPVATTAANQTVVDPDIELTLNYGTAVTPNGATVVARSSEFAYLDRDESEDVSDNETVRSYPIATVERVGNGQVFVVGDPSIFINAMQERDGNRVFAAALLEGTDRVLIDVSHSSSPPPLVQLLLFVRGSPWIQFGIGIVGLTIVGWWHRDINIHR